MDRTILNAIAEAVSRDGRILAAYLLGSAAQGRMREDSDIDIAVIPFASAKINASGLAALAAEITLIAGRTADIGIISSSNLVYARQAILTGESLMCRDDARRDHITANLLGLYAQFHYERREVLDAYFG